MVGTAGGACWLTGESLSISSLEHKSIKEGGVGEGSGGRTGASSLAGGVCGSFQRKGLELAIYSSPLFTGEPVVFKVLSSYF